MDAKQLGNEAAWAEFWESYFEVLPGLVDDLDHNTDALLAELAKERP